MADEKDVKAAAEKPAAAGAVGDAPKKESKQRSSAAPPTPFPAGELQSTVTVKSSLLAGAILAGPVAASAYAAILIKSPDGRKPFAFAASELASRLGTSEAVARRAMKSLTNAGLIVATSKRGGIVVFTLGTDADVARAKAAQQTLVERTTTQAGERPASPKAAEQGKGADDLSTADAVWTKWSNTRTADGQRRPLSTNADRQAAEALATLVRQDYLTPADLAECLHRFSADTDADISRQGHALRLLPELVPTYLS